MKVEEEDRGQVRPDPRLRETEVSRKRLSLSGKDSAPVYGTSGCHPCALSLSHEPADGTTWQGTPAGIDFPTTDSAHLSPSQPGRSSPTLPRHPLLHWPVRASHSLGAALSQVRRHLIQG